MADFQVVVYGATGFTGRLICKELVRRGLSFAVAGRDRQKLDALAASLGASKPEIIVARLEAPDALARMAGRAKVTLACAGPFSQFGKPILDAAIAGGSHYLDITGEAAYMLATTERDAEARARGVALINAVGFDVVPSDAAAALAAEIAGAPVAELRIAFINQGGRPTQGTTRSALHHADQGGLAFIDGSYVREPVGTVRWRVPFPPPIGVRDCFSIPWGDLASAPRSTGARTLRTFVAMPKALGSFMPLVGVASKTLAWAPMRAFAERCIRSLPEGPSDEQRAAGRFAIYAEARGKAGTRAAWVTGGDGYDFTAASAALCAERAAAPEFAAKGALTPTQAFGARALLDGLADSGVAWGLA
jgi:saccharopine dehydrogenase (NAD+, L-lysine-forming)